MNKVFHGTILSFLLLLEIIMSHQLEVLFEDHLKIIKSRFERAMEADNVTSIVIPAGIPKGVFLDDMEYNFVANPHFKTWVPVTNNPFCWIVFRLDEKPLIIFYEAKDFWHKAVTFSENFWSKLFNIEIIHQPEDAFQHLPGNSANAAFLGEWHSKYQNRLDQLKINPEYLCRMLDMGRTVKTEYEILNLQKANEIAVKGHVAAENAFRCGESELGIHLQYLQASSQMEQQVPYGNIVALNENSAILHYQHCNPEKPISRNSFLIDAGATSNGYASDITRTYAAEENVFDEMIAAFDILQQSLVSQLEPSISYISLHQQAHQRMAQFMAEFNMLECSSDIAYEKGVTQTFFPHGLGHFLGLQVHDMAGKQLNEAGEMIEQPQEHPFLRLLRTLEVGNVVTVEPGFYFIPSLLKPLKNSAAGKCIKWSTVESLIPFGGIRIEDDVVVRDQGQQNLTRDAFAANV